MSKYNYTVKLSNRRTLSIKILEDNSIQVNCFWRTTKEQIERFLQEKSGWIDKNIAKNTAKNERFADVISYKQILVCGKQVPLFIDGKNGVSFDEVHVVSLSYLRYLYVNSFGDEFVKSFKELAELTSLKYKSIQFKDYKSRWGCCDKDGNIIFNYKILMLPKPLQQYVMLHELCHTVYMDHSKNFYKLLQEYMPQYKSAVKELKNYSRICRLY